MFHTLAWVSQILELKNIKDSIGKSIFGCYQTATRLRYFSQSDRLGAYLLFLASYFDVTLTTGIARVTDT